MQQQAFHPIYLGLGVHKANPISIAENEYKRGGIGSKLSYRFFLHDEWAVGLSGGFKTLTKDSDLKETFLTLSQETQRLFRIYHPFWLGLGTQIMYIAGVENSGFPIERDPTQPPQVGVGAGISLFYIMNSSLLTHGDVSRWRGTASNRLHVLEVGIGISIALN